MVTDLKQDGNHGENYERDREAVERQCKFLSDNAALFGQYIEELIDLATGLPMYREEYPESEFFKNRSDVCGIFTDLLDSLEDAGIGIFLPEFLRKSLLRE